MRLTKNSSVCSKLFLRDLEIDRKIGLIRDIIYYIESDRRDELHNIEIEEFRELKEEVGIWTTIARPPVTGELTYNRLTNVDNLKKRFKVNKTELETKYYDV